MNSSISHERVRYLNENKVNPMVNLYFMYDFSTKSKMELWIKFAVEMARKLDKPLLVVESLNIDHKWSSDRIHNFVINGMLNNRSDFEDTS